ncbi:unnamed protein product [marine sediment metagenome]|uniref:Uncharacterized protein n=1 Tax=marine sediment metagenome TaxID=412755 RepID=X1IA06_9ZZZZ
MVIKKKEEELKEKTFKTIQMFEGKGLLSRESLSVLEELLKDTAIEFFNNFVKGLENPTKNKLFQNFVNRI